MSPRRLLTLVIAFCLLCLSASSQSQLRPCKDGSVSFDYASVLSGVFLPSTSSPEPVVTFFLYNGRFVPCNTPGNFAGHYFRYRTGPRTDGGTDLSHGATFGPGGWFQLYAEDDEKGHLWLFCGQNGIACSFNASTKAKAGLYAWDYTTITPKQLANGTWVYEVSGTLTGTYNDPIIANQAGVKAIFSQQTVNSAGLLFGPSGNQEFAGGTLQVVNQVQ